MRNGSNHPTNEPMRSDVVSDARQFLAITYIVAIFRLKYSTKRICRSKLPPQGGGNNLINSSNRNDNDN